MKKLLKKLMRFRDDESGASTVELVIVATTFMTGFFWVFETGLIMTKQMMLERAMDMVVRDLRLYSTPPTKTENETMYDWAKDEICDLALIFKDCQRNLYLKTFTFNPGAATNAAYSCENRDQEMNPGTEFVIGARSEIMIMQACILVDPMMPNGIALFPNVTDKGVPIVAETAFMNEPE